MPYDYSVALPPFQGVDICTDGSVRFEGELLEYGTFMNGDLRILIDDGRTIFNGAPWKLILAAFYMGNKQGVEPIFLDGNRHNHSFWNIEFVDTDPETGEYKPRRYREIGYFRKFDARLKARILCVETGIVYNTLQEAADSCQGQKSNLSAVLHGRLSTHRGFHWRWVD